jgi:hypothetical protein
LTCKKQKNYNKDLNKFKEWKVLINLGLRRIKILDKAAWLNIYKAENSSALVQVNKQSQNKF